MERSPRSAGVRPRTGATMGQCHTLRSFAISLAIAIAITNSPANGFTIRRPENPYDSLPDLETGESTHLEVRYDLKGVNEKKTIDNNTSKGELDSSVIAINDPNNVDKKNYSIQQIEKVNATQLPLNETTGMQAKVLDNRIFETTTDTSTKMDRNSTEINSTEMNSTETASSSFTTSTQSTSQTTTREPESNQDLTTNSMSQTLNSFDSNTNTITEYSKETTKNDILTLGVKENETKTTDMTTVSESITTPEMNYKGEIHSFTEKPTTIHIRYSLNNSNADESDVKGNDSATAESTLHKDVTLSFFDVKNETTTTPLNTDHASTNVDILSTRTEETLDVTTTTLTPEPKTTTVMTEVTTAEVTTELIIPETTTTDYVPITLPPWKKYTTIERKRTSTEETTQQDMTQAETAQTRISLEKVFSNTPIPSLEKLKNDLINAQGSTTRKIETTNTTTTTTTDASNVVASETTTPTPVMTTEIATLKLEIVSRRAGYKDNRETTTPKPIEATTSVVSVKGSVNDTEMFNSMYETEPSESEMPDTKNVTVYESQSQLAEDAIKEELLKEETLNDNAENAHRHHEEDENSSKANTTEVAVTAHEIVTEDMLSVKPIGNERKKNTILYAVSPNYKPLKKIDVQPAKPFVRDPDDNSWRNESISSLGIVFKPKNASKSFTQVLKNKTETELANMTDKDNKGDVPDLRVRLEKIAEVRKSKKRINKFGDTVYSDYEESSENVNASKEEITSPMHPLADPALSFTPPTPPTSVTTDYDLTVNAISKERIDIFKNDLTTPVITDKPKKFFNMAEYYDSTDDYDADYANIHKIDLKKFTKPLSPKVTSVTQPPDQLRTTPTREYPERKATLQYFPPTQKVTQKVNLNDYDSDFQKRVNLYTFKEPVKNPPSGSFVTVSPPQTEQYEQVVKVTGKPFTPVHKTDNLNKNLYLTNQPRVSEPPRGFIPNDGNFNRASYVIKHYRDFINEAAKESEDERAAEYPYTESPLRGVTINELAKMTTIRDNNQGEDDYEYDVKFRKDIMNRFVDNFNQNSERFKVDFPILYNSSVVHGPALDNGKPASSTAFLKSLYEVPRSSNFLSNRKACDPHCDNMTVELSPAYELHYYVPDQEEKEEMEPHPYTPPYRFRL